MKKTTVIFISLLAAIQLQAQNIVILNFETHALKGESDNNMQLCKYVLPGDDGENIIWDFSGIEKTNAFTGFVKSSYHSVNSQIFPQANTELQEFNNRFYFRIADNRIEQVGYASKDNTVVTAFDKPFVKMVYPFTMGDHFEGIYGGLYKTGTQSSVIRGNYLVEADAYGTLILPENFIVANTLRVKTMKNYTYQINGSDHLFEITTYRWYCDWYRYPLLVLTRITSTVNNSTSVINQAAYNNQLSIPATTISKRILGDRLFEVYPNPTNRLLRICYSVKDGGRVSFVLYNLSGAEIKILYDEDMTEGTYHLESDLTDEGLSEGVYLLKADIAGHIQAQQIILTE
ncbi:MAG: T9SS type A sorting domain-containing protein [Bacteroidales bacterium]|nr:T9SS type A sorting domain-containing protein [Bacteroidales bacterium]